MRVTSAVRIPDRMRSWIIRRHARDVGRADTGPDEKLHDLEKGVAVVNLGRVYIQQDRDGGRGHFKAQSKSGQGSLDVSDAGYAHMADG